MKKTLNVCIVLFVMLLMCAHASADGNKHVSGLYTYVIKGNGTIEIIDYDWHKQPTTFAATGTAYEDIYIPTMLDGYTIASIGDEAFMFSSEYPWDGECYPETVSQSKCSVTLPNTVKSIGTKAFAYSGITSINIPDSVQVIGAGAFLGCTNCQFNVSVSQQYFASIDGILYNKAQKEAIAFSWKQAEGKEICIPEGIVSIGDFAFAFCNRDLSETGNQKAKRCNVTFPSTLCKIGRYAFANASLGLKCNCHKGDRNVSYHKYNFIGDYAFSGSSVSGKIEVPSSIGTGVFNYMWSNLKIANINEVNSIGPYNTGLGYSFESASDFSPELKTIPVGLHPKTAEIPATVERIESDAYSGIVHDFILPSSISYIADDAFRGGSTFVVDAGSYAELWCSENGFGYTINGTDPYAWLNS